MRMLDELNDRIFRCEILPTEWEERFINDMTERMEEGERLTDGQFMKLRQIYDEHVGKQ